MPERAVKGAINGMELEVPFGTTVLKAAEILGIRIPTLCHHEGLPPWGGCRLCLSEIKGSLAASCMYPLREDGFAVFTDTLRAREARSFVLSLFLTRAPKAPLIRKLAAEYGAEPFARSPLEADGCLRCGRCVRACQIQASEAVSLAGRGSERRVSPPFGKPPENCLGCLACALICPAGCVPFKDDGVKRRIWEKDFELAPCPVCGKRTHTYEQLKFFGADKPLCPQCQGRATAEALKANEFVTEF
ncbi:MAG: (2Fe-2S)-binding protein [Deltaproteobacteria bacterium]|jgi:NADH dehydrogenase/NADH:ubiquinone oxidoreductase subunit G|nr:(2Fe-2S)-binding protein [Deltaproteobacteria bacterium]